MLEFETDSENQKVGSTGSQVQLNLDLGLGPLDLDLDPALSPCYEALDLR